MIQMELRQAIAALHALPLPVDTVFTGCGIDSRALATGALFIALRGQRVDGHEYVTQAAQCGAAAALVERPVSGCALPQVVVTDTRLAMGRLAAHWRQQFTLPLIAVTGSNGKTTVKEMLAHLLAQAAPVLATQGNFNNDIGLPLTLFRLGPEHCHAVVELGANHPGEIAYLAQLARPSIAVITLCAPAHLQGFGSLEGVARAKGELFSALPADGCAVINADDPFAAYWHTLPPPTCRRLRFGFQASADCQADALELAPFASAFTLHTPWGTVRIHLPLPGQHNIANSLAAASCALAAGVALDSLPAAFATLPPVPGRLRPTSGIRNITVLDDTYNANPHSTRAALRVLAQYPAPRWLVLGDMGELGELAEPLHVAVGEWAKAEGVDALYALGDLSRHAVLAFGANGHHFTDAAALIDALRQTAPNGATVLIKGSRAMRMEQAVQALAVAQ